MESSTIFGDYKHKPISYYVEDACRILHTWQQYQNALNISLNQINIRDVNTLKQFERRTTFPTDFASNLDRYLMFSTFLLTTSK